MSNRQERLVRSAVRSAMTTLATLCPLLLVVPASAADNSGSTDQTLQEVVVLGVRGAQEKAVQLKRDASFIEDSISAEDIGKLPDTTIADSLQRITGVQIDRVGGEGTAINVRGLPQVGTSLNGEAFLTADQVADTTHFERRFSIGARASFQ